MTIPPGGPTPPELPSEPPPPSISPGAPSGGDSKIMQSPFAQMFAATGSMPTAKEMKAIMNGILMQEVRNIKQQDKRWKEAMKKLKKAIKGED
ncbi:MAG: hypothetical protein KR126chlam1_01241 [Chlamydiae bacterium]|nr:hypothetical protein [Chlamydiota bacterium]